MSFGKFLGDSGDKNKNQTVDSSTSTSFVNSATSSKTVVGAGCKVTGNLEFKDNAEVAGQVEGEIKSYSRLLISESAKIKANIIGVDVTIQGEFQGEVTASGKLCLLRPARILGNVTCASLSIEEGVLFEGRCMMAKKDSLSTKEVVGKDPRTDSNSVSAIKAA
jgi:cytoskeletal protein CcmA (bactofilin family)